MNQYRLFVFNLRWYLKLNWKPKINEYDSKIKS
jgi:hypothetical protein